MATTTTQPPPGPQAVPTAKRPVGRPPKVRVNGPDAPSIGEEGSYWEWLDSIQREAWQNLICYVWRCGPITDVGTGKPTTIAKIGQPFDANFILETYGSGVYRFDIVSQPKSPGEKATCIRRTYETLIDMRFPPRVPIGMWMDDPRNKEWEWAKPQLEEEAVKRIAANQPQPGNSLVDTIELATKLKELTGGNSEASMVPVVMQLLQRDQEALRNYQDPAKQMQTLKGLLEMAGGNRKDDSSKDIFMQFLLEEMRAMRAERAQLQQQPAADGLTTSLATLKSVVETLGGLGLNLGAAAVAGKAGGSQIGEIVGDVLTKVIDKGTDVLPMLVEAYKFGKDRDLQTAVAGAQQQQAQQQQRRNPARPWEYDPNAQPNPAAAAPAPTSAPVAQMPPPAPTGPMTPTLLFAKHAQLIQSIGPILMDHYQNSDGGAFQDWFIDRKGRDTFNLFRADATPEMLTEAVTKHPSLKMIFTPEEKVLEFFQDFLSDPDEEDEDEGEILTEAQNG